MVALAPGDGTVADQVPLQSVPQVLYGVAYVARELGINRMYVSFLAHRRVFPFLPTHEYAGAVGSRRKALFTAERVAAIVRCYNDPSQVDELATNVELVYGVGYLAQMLGRSRTWIWPLVQERVAPFIPTHELVRGDGTAWAALFTAQRIQQIVEQRRRPEPN